MTYEALLRQSPAYWPDVPRAVHVVSDRAMASCFLTPHALQFSLPPSTAIHTDEPSSRQADAALDGRRMVAASPRMKPYGRLPKVASV